MTAKEVTVHDAELTFGRSAAEASQVRRFEFVEGSSAKFWEIRVEGKDLIVRFGRIGTKGQEQRKTFDDASGALASAEMLITEKTNKGYHRVGGEDSGAETESTEDVEYAEAAPQRKRPTTRLSKFDFDQFGFKPPPRKKVLLTPTKAFDEAIIEFGPGKRARREQEALLKPLGLWTVERLPEEFVLATDLGDHLATDEFLVGLPCRGFLQTLYHKNTLLRVVLVKGGNAGFCKRVEEASNQRRRIDEAIELLIKKAAGETVIAFGIDPNAPYFVVHTREAVDRQLEKLAHLPLFAKSRVARNKALLWHPSTSVERLSLRALGVQTETLEEVLNALEPKLRKRLGPQVSFAADADAALKDARKAVQGLSPSELMTSGQGEDGFFLGRFESVVDELVKEDPVRFAPAVVEALVRSPDNNFISRKEWIVTESGIERYKGDKAFAENLKKLFAASKRLRFATALHFVGFPKPKTSHDQRTVLNASDYK